MISGTGIAFFEISLYLYISYSLRKYFKNLQNIDTVTYYWFIMTVLTFIWETSYIIHFNEISHISGDLIMNKNHVWTNKYPISSIILLKGLMYIIVSDLVGAASYLFNL